MFTYYGVVGNLFTFFMPAAIRRSRCEYVAIMNAAEWMASKWNAIRFVLWIELHRSIDTHFSTFFGRLLSLWFVSDFARNSVLFLIGEVETLEQLFHHHAHIFKLLNVNWHNRNPFMYRTTRMSALEPSAFGLKFIVNRLSASVLDIIKPCCCSPKSQILTSQIAHSLTRSP